MKYEERYEKMHPNWEIRFGYLLRYFPTTALKELKDGKFPISMLRTNGSET